MYSKSGVNIELKQIPKVTKNESEIFSYKTVTYQASGKTFLTMKNKNKKI